MEEEIKNIIKVWISTLASLTYCYFITPKIPKGLPRLLSLLPIFYIFSILPLTFSSIHLRGISAFFLTWLTNFKLLLFSFNQGPLTPPQKINLLHFITTASLPIKLKGHIDPPSGPHNEKVAPIKPKIHIDPQSGLHNEKVAPISLGLKGLILGLIIFSYKYKAHLHENVLLGLYCIHIYLALEVVLAAARTAARAAVGASLEPQFDEPYLASSLQDFWGRRWNLMVTSILRPTVYDPIRRTCARGLGARWAQVVGLWAAFAVSGLMHEAMFYYITCESPTWEVTWFFVLHGFCTSVEVWVKRAMTSRCRLPRVVSGILTLGFVVVTGYWLFFPQIVRSGTDEKVIQEYSALVCFLKDKSTTWGSIVFLAD